MGWDPRDYGPQHNRSVPSQLATSHERGRPLPPPAPPVIDQPIVVDAAANTIAAQVQSAQNDYWQFARQQLEQRPGNEIGDKLHAAAVANTELGRAATDLGPRAIKEQVVDAAQGRLAAAIAAKRINGDPAQEVRNDRFWEGKREVLTSKEGTQEVVLAAQRMLESADGNELSVLYERLPDFLAAKGLTDSFIAPTLQRRPEVAGPAAEVVAATKAWHTAQGNAEMLKNAVHSGRVPHTLISTQPFDPDAVPAQ
jgi:hypothetical protein